MKFFLFLIALIFALLYFSKQDASIQLDLPEEYQIATKADTMIAIKDGNILRIEFKH